MLQKPWETFTFGTFLVLLGAFTHILLIFGACVAQLRLRAVPGLLQDGLG